LRKLLSVAGAVALCSSCSYQIFKDLDDIENETWVHVSSRPDQISSETWPVALTSGGPTANGVNFISAGDGPSAYARLIFDERGSIETDGLRLSDSTRDATISLMVTNPEPSAGDNVAIAFTDGTGPHLALLNGETGSSNIPTIAISNDFPGGTDAPTALAVGASGAIFVGLGNEIVIYPGFGTQPALQCASISETDTLEALLAVPGPAATNGTLLAITSAGIVSFPLSPTLECQNGGFRPDPGSAATVGQFAGGPAADVAVGDPATNTVRIYPDVADAPGTEPILLAAPAGASSFGAVLARGDIDGDGVDELIIADPDATVDGAQGAGRVHIYSSGAFDGPEVTIHDGDPKADQRFGASMAVSSFKGTDDLLSVGARGEVFTYFRLAVGNDQDVRTR